MKKQKRFEVLKPELKTRKEMELFTLNFSYIQLAIFI
jgi:hypothetical protein